MFWRIGEGKLHYELVGEGRPILMLHGFPLDSAVMKGCMEPVFARHNDWKRVYVDLPGMGRSTRIKGANGSDGILDVLMRFAQEMFGGERFAVAGESYGGYLARGLLRERMSEVTGVLLICPLVLAPPCKRELPPRKVLIEEPGLEEAIKEGEESFAELGVVQTERTLERFREDIVPGLRSGDKEFQRELFSDGYEFSVDVDVLPHQYHGPTLVIAGRQDHVVGYRDAWNFLENYPRATFAVLDRAGHNLQFEQEKLFASLVNEWLNRVEEANAKEHEVRAEREGGA